jgi:spore coat polysaccharide biosynthesis predicted glycosyltransferase SpsG
MKKISILTEGSLAYGFGHIVRCTSFYDELEENGCQVEFIIEGDDTVENIINNRKYKLLQWHGNILDIITDLNNSDAVILDSLYLTQSDIDILCNQNFVILSIDDFLRNKYTNSIILDWTINSNLFNKHKHNEKDNHLFIGVENAIIRKSFFESKKNSNISIINNKIEDILIIMGGTDIRDLTKPILNLLLYKFPNVCLHIIYNNKLNLKKQHKSRVNVYSNLNASELRDVMLNCDIAISAGGQTLYELATIGLPTIAIKVIDNQTEDIIGWVKAGLIINIIEWDDPKLSEKLVLSIDKLDSLEQRIKIKNKVINIISSNNINKITNFLITMINDKSRK